MNAIRLYQYGDPEVMQVEEIPIPPASEGEVLVKTEAIGVNFKDIYHRNGKLRVVFPFIPGIEASGTIEEAGKGNCQYRKGERVAFIGSCGCYAEYVTVPIDQIVRLPDQISFDAAAAVLLQGMTAHYLTHSTVPLKPGDRCLIHAAAGGVGHLLCQMAKRLGASIIATVSTKEKAQAAKEAGADEVIVYTQEDFEVEVRRLTQGRGLDVVYDSVGKATFMKSLDCLRPRGMLVSFGNSSGNPDPLRIMDLAEKGSLFVTRPSLAHYASNRMELVHRSGDIFKWVISGELIVRIGGIFGLQDAPEAHRLLEGRETMGKLLLAA